MFWYHFLLFSLYNCLNNWLFDCYSFLFNHNLSPILFNIWLDWGFFNTTPYSLGSLKFVECCFWNSLPAIQKISSSSLLGFIIVIYSLCTLYCLNNNDSNVYWDNFFIPIWFSKKKLMRLINMEYTKSMIKLNAQIYKNY